MPIFFCFFNYSSLKKEKIEKLIDEKKIEVRTITHAIKGNSKKQPIIKYRLELEVKPYVQKHIFKYSESSKTEFPKEKIVEYEKEYDEILELAKEKNKKIKSSYYKVKKAKLLYNRLKKYKKNHLYFIEDFSVLFDNNLSE